MAGRRGKRYREAMSGVDRTHACSPAEAIALIKQTAGAKFDQTVEVHMRLGVNVRHAEEQLRGTLALPNGLGKSITVAVFAEGDAARAANEAGADFVGAQELADRVAEGWTDFDVAIATPSLMGPVVSKLGRVLGPQGKMPNPKVGTVTDDVGKAVERGQGRQGRVPHRSPGDHPPDARQGELRRAPAARELRGDDRRDRPREAGGRQGPLPAVDHPRDDDGPGVHVDASRTRELGDASPESAGARRRGRGRDPAAASTTRYADAAPKPAVARRGRLRCSTTRSTSPYSTGLLRAEEAIALGVGVDALDALAGVGRVDLLHATAQLEHLARVDLDVGRSGPESPRSAGGVDQAVRQRHALAVSAAGEDQQAARHRDPEAHGLHAGPMNCIAS